MCNLTWHSTLTFGDARAISAILFMCEIDNFCYAVGLSERVRSRVESVGHIELSSEDAAALVRMKTTHVSVLTCSVVGGVMLAGANGKLAALGKETHKQADRPLLCLPLCHSHTILYGPSVG